METNGCEPSIAMDEPINELDDEVRAERERLWKRARYLYVLIYSLFGAALIFSIVAVVRLLGKVLK